jgi:hypothetical protein
MQENILDDVERLGWLKRRENDLIVLSLPDIGEVRFARSPNATYGALQLPQKITASFRRQFTSVQGMWDWAQFEIVARWLLNNCLTDVQRSRLRDLRNLDMELLHEPITESTAVVKVRLFQDRLRDLLLRIRGRCEITCVCDSHLLVASHIIPWSSCARDGRQRLDLENVLLLAANWDALFDKFYISFEPETGKMIKSRRIDEVTLAKFGVPANWRESVRVDVSGARRRKYLQWHNVKMEEVDQESQNGCAVP